MDINKDSYTLTYAVVMVVIVALLLSFVSSALKEKQTSNMEIDKKKQILRSLQLNLKDQNTEALYDKYIVNGFIINSDAEILAESKDDAFHVDIVKESVKPLDERRLPIYIADVEGRTKYVISLRGAGLWGALWGYLALNDDKNTIFGVCFSHAGETPGLGANITDAWFQNQFAGKRILNGTREFVSIAVMKTGTRAEGSEQVDAISGGTITSKGVHDMLYNSLSQYAKFFQLTAGEEE